MRKQTIPLIAALAVATSTMAAVVASVGVAEGGGGRLQTSTVFPKRTKGTWKEYAPGPASASTSTQDASGLGFRLRTRAPPIGPTALAVASAQPPPPPPLNPPPPEASGAGSRTSTSAELKCVKVSASKGVLRRSWQRAHRSTTQATNNANFKLGSSAQTEDF